MDADSLDDYFSRDFSTAESRKPARGLAKEKYEDGLSESDDLSLTRSYPEIFYTLLKLAHDNSLSSHLTFSGSAWERHVVHSLSRVLKLKHSSTKNRNREFVAQVWKPNQDGDLYQVPTGEMFRLLPTIFWEAEEVRLVGNIEFSEAIVKHSGIYCAIVRFSANMEEKLVFPADLSEKEQIAAIVIAREFNLNPSIMRFPNGSGEFLLIEKSRNYKESSSLSLEVIQKNSGRDRKFDLMNFPLLPILTDIYDTGIVRDKDGKTVRCLAGVTGRTGRFLQWMINENLLKKTLEIGLAYGISALHICQAHLNNGFGADVASHTAIDPFQESDWKSIGLLNLQKAGFHSQDSSSVRFKFIGESSEYALPKLCTNGKEIGTYDMILIDGNHLFDHVMVDTFYSLRLLKVGGFLILDDTDTSGVSKVLSYILNNVHMLRPFTAGCFGRVFTFKKICKKDARPWFFDANF